MKKIFNYFTVFEFFLWLISVTLITASFILFDRENTVILITSLIGVTSLIYCAKGNPFGEFLMIVFSIIYGAISYGFSYYGEMVTYLGMTLPMSVVCMISWLNNPYHGKKSQVKVSTVSKNDIILMCAYAFIVTVIFYFILKYFNTANLIPSTVSVTTSFIAAYLTYKRSPYFALGYATNDIILVILWALASLTDKKYIAITICFLMFLINDLYGFFNWKRMAKRQSANL